MTLQCLQGLCNWHTALHTQAGNRSPAATAQQHCPLSKDKCCAAHAGLEQKLDAARCYVRACPPTKVMKGVLDADQEPQWEVRPDARAHPCLSAKAIAASLLPNSRPDRATVSTGSAVDVQPISGFSHLHRAASGMRVAGLGRQQRPGAVCSGFHRPASGMASSSQAALKGAVI